MDTLLLVMYKITIELREIKTEKMLAVKFTENRAKGKINGECHMALQRYKIYL